MKALLIEWRNDIPLGAMQLAFRRTNDMLRHYGANITHMSIEVLCASCYLQGVEDCFQVKERPKHETPIDCQI